MYLNYRGQLYKAQLSPVGTIETEITAHYRGEKYQLRQLPEPPNDPRWFYRYRGVAYMSGPESRLPQQNELTSLSLVHV